MPQTLRKFYEFANFRFDVSRKVLLRDGEPLGLAPKVFDTLEILIENAGILLEKGELINRVWHDHFVEESNLTSNIKMLRKALGDERITTTGFALAPNGKNFAVTKGGWRHDTVLLKGLK